MRRTQVLFCPAAACDARGEFDPKVERGYTTMSMPLTQHEITPPAMSSVRRHERVLDEAARQLNAKGVSLTSLTEIAEKLGISRAAMYYYVEDREDLVFSVIAARARSLPVI